MSSLCHASDDSLWQISGLYCSTPPFYCLFSLLWTSTKEVPKKENFSQQKTKKELNLSGAMLYHAVDMKYLWLAKNSWALCHISTRRVTRPYLNNTAESPTKQPTTTKNDPVFHIKAKIRVKPPKQISELCFSFSLLSHSSHHDPSDLFVSLWRRPTLWWRKCLRAILE